MFITRVFPLNLFAFSIRTNENLAQEYARLSAFPSTV